MLYEHGYIEIGDIVLTHAWLKSLLYAGYKFPSLVTSNATTVGLTPIVSPTKNNNSNIQVDIEVANMTTIKKQLPTLANTSNTSTERVETIVISNDKKIKPGNRAQLKKRMRL